VVEMKDHPDTLKAITLTVAQTDGTAKAAPAPAPAPKKEEPKSLFASDDEPVEEPTKVVRKSAPAPSADDGDLSSIIDNWDD
jgi:hypothetical protein